ncbi:HNH endonuclease signature motif containing protein, partial [Actinomycetospora cinnamomea]
GLEKVAARLLADLDPDGVAPDEREARHDEVRWVSRRDGTLWMTAVIADALGAEILREGFDAGSTPAGPDDDRTLAHRRAAALVEAFADARRPGGAFTDDDTDPADTDPADTDPVDTDTTSDTDTAAGADTAAGPDADPDPAGGPTSDPGGDTADPEGGPTGAGEGDAGAAARDPAEDALIPAPRRPEPPAPVAGPGPVRAPGRAQVTITMDHRWLQLAIGHGTLESGALVDPRSVRRAACDAELIPMILGTRSEPLDVGRMARTVPDGLRRALHLRDGGCAFPGCTRRPRRCHAHHIDHWIDGGPTALDNCVLLCAFHHQLIHHGHWTAEILDGLPWFTPPPWIDPERQRRPGGRPRIPT